MKTLESGWREVPAGGGQGLGEEQVVELFLLIQNNALYITLICCFQKAMTSEFLISLH